MFLTLIVLSAIAVALFKLGALSVWLAVLSMAFKAILFVASSASLSGLCVACGFGTKDRSNEV